MNLLDRLEEAARAASAECDEPGDWFSPDLLDSDEPIHSTRKARAYIAALSPDVALAVIAVCRAAKEVDALVIPPIVEPAFADLRESLAALEAMEQP